MKFRVASIAFLLASAATGITWLSVQPLLVRLVDVMRKVAPGQLVLFHLERVLPLYLGLDLLVVGLLAYAVLYVTVARPLQDTEQQVNQLEHLDLQVPLPASAGPLLSRLQASLRRAAEALRKEQALTRTQVKDLQQSHLRLTEAQMELVASERLATVGKLAAGVAHEVGNPLSGILGYLSLAKDRAKMSGPELLEFLDPIDGEVQRIDGIVRGLLDLGRPSRGVLGPVDLARLTQTCVKLVGSGPDFSQVDVQQDVSPGALVMAESGPLSQVLINLLLNAAQAQEGRGEILVRGRAQGSHFELEVLDRGPGLSEELQERIFEPFFTTKAAGKGTGLGLSVSRHLVQTMNGELLVGNAVGGGGRFTLRLPLA